MDQKLGRTPISSAPLPHPATFPHPQNHKRIQRAGSGIRNPVPFAGNLATTSPSESVCDTCGHRPTPLTAEANVGRFRHRPWTVHGQAPNRRTACGGKLAGRIVRIGSSETIGVAGEGGRSIITIVAQVVSGDRLSGCDRSGERGSPIPSRPAAISDLAWVIEEIFPAPS
jgi:hypothetical protein